MCSSRVLVSLWIRGDNMALLMFLKRLVGGTGGGGLFGYLARKDDNKTSIELDGARQAAAKDLIDKLPNGAVLRESTPDGWRLEIWMPPLQVPPLFILDADRSEPVQGLPTPIELSAQQSKALNQTKTVTANDSLQEGPTTRAE